MSEFRDKAPVRDLGDPTTDPPLTVRVRAEPGDQHARLFDRSSLRAVRLSEAWTKPWIVVAGPDPDEWELPEHGPFVGWWLTDDEVRTWPVVPAYAVSAPWTLNAAQAAPATAAHERGDMDERGDLGVEAFRG